MSITADSDKSPRVFISYSWDSIQHKAWVRLLAERLVENGVNARLDQWVVQPGESFTQFMESEVANADYVLIVCTPAYAKKAITRNGGVGYEQQIVSGRLISGIPRSRFIPIIRSGEYELGRRCAIPENFLGIVALDFRDDKVFPQNLEALLRTLFSKPEFSSPPIGKPPDFFTTIHTVVDSTPSVGFNRRDNTLLLRAGREIRRRKKTTLVVVALVSTFLPVILVMRENPLRNFPIHPITSTPTDKKKVVHDFSDPTYEAFELISDRKTVDLRDWREVPQSKIAEPISPVTLTREIKARKKVAVNTIRFQFSTGGLPMDFDCKTQEYSVEEKAPGPTGSKAEIQYTYQVVIDIAKVRIGEEFTVVIEATYWNAFQPPDGNSMAMRIHAPVGLVSLTMIFPDNWNSVDYKLRDIIFGSKEQPAWDVSKGVILADKNKKTIYWEIPNPEVGHAYKIDWTL